MNERKSEGRLYCWPSLVDPIGVMIKFIGRLKKRANPTRFEIIVYEGDQQIGSMSIGLDQESIAA